MRSITWRLTLWYTAILMSIILVCGTAAFWGMRYYIFSNAYWEMNTYLSAIKKYVISQVQDDNYSKVNLDDPELIESFGNVTLWIQISTPDGKILNKSRAFGNNDLLAPGYKGSPIETEFREHKYLLAGAELTDDSTVQVAFPLYREEHFLEMLSSVLVLLSFAGLLLAVAGGRLITRKALSPVTHLTSTARQISATDLSRRIALNGSRDELYTLAETFNQMLDRLEKGFRSQQEFVAAASHDLRTPLTIVKSYNVLLKRWGKDDRAVLEEAIQATDKAVGTMERLVNGLLLLARMQARPPFNMVLLSLAELVEETAREARVLSGDIRIETEIKDQVLVPADEYYLRRALWALIDNAIKYNRPGGKVTLRVAVSDNKKEADLSVTDTGQGIDEKDLPRLFDRFFRGDLVRSQGKGFGLGLSLAKEIVEAHRGRITVDSRPGVGSRFTIVLPLGGEQ